MLPGAVTVIPWFVAQLTCPVCAWAALSTASSYAEAEQRVSHQLLEHVIAAHPDAAHEREPEHTATPPPAA